MSRIGKREIILPAGTTATLSGQELKIKGPTGELVLLIHPNVQVNQKENILTLQVVNPNDRSQRALWGLFGSLIQNMVDGVNKGYEKKLEINGVGYKAQVSGNKLVLNLGYSHPVEFLLPAGITAAVEKNVITLNGIDKQAVGQVAANIRVLRKPEPYKGKGIKYAEEVLRKKVGKAAKAVGSK
jgi:large subunit ribosomal protein L6